MLKDKIKELSKNKKKQAFFRARQAGIFREIALNSGNTGELRKPISHKEAMHLKKKRKMAKQSRKVNRK